MFQCRISLPSILPLTDIVIPPLPIPYTVHTGTDISVSTGEGFSDILIYTLTSLCFSVLDMCYEDSVEAW